jgi:hypothetical protein
MWKLNDVNAGGPHLNFALASVAKTKKGIELKAIVDNM